MRILYALGAVCIFSGLACLESSFAQAKRAETPSKLTKITADKITFDYEKHHAFLERNVVVLDPEVRITCDEMMVLFGEDNKIYRITAKGNVFIEENDRAAAHCGAGTLLRSRGDRWNA